MVRNREGTQNFPRARKPATKALQDARYKAALPWMKGGVSSRVNAIDGTYYLQACEPHDRGDQNDNKVWVRLVKNGAERIYGNPPDLILGHMKRNGQ